MVYRVLTVAKFATTSAVLCFGVCCFHSIASGQVIVGEEEVIPVGEEPPSDSGGSEPSGDPQVVPGGEEPADPAPNEDLVCGTLQNSPTNACSNIPSVSCLKIGMCDSPDASGNANCRPRDKNKNAFERVVTKEGDVSRVPLQISSGVAQVFSRTAQTCYQEFACAAHCRVGKSKRLKCVSGFLSSSKEVFKYTEDKTKACVNNNVISVGTAPVPSPETPVPDSESRTQN